MSRIVVTLIGPNNENVGRIRVKLEGLPEDYVVLPEVLLIPLESPQIVLGVQLNGVSE